MLPVPSPFERELDGARTFVLQKEVPYEVVTVDLSKGAHKQPEHLARQPFGQIPAIEDGDVKAFESRAIARYACSFLDGCVNSQRTKACRKGSVALIESTQPPRVALSRGLLGSALRTKSYHGHIGCRQGILKLSTTMSVAFIPNFQQDGIGVNPNPQP